MGIFMLIVWIVGGILLFVVYHKLFDVVYFNVGKGCLVGILWCGFGGYLLAALFMSHWLIAVVNVIVLFLIAF